MPIVRKSFFLILFTTFMSSVTAQVYLSPSRYYFHESIENPALVSVYKNPRFTISEKKQWPFIYQGPSTTIVSVSKRFDDFTFYNRKFMLNKTRLRVTNRAGYGAFLVHDKNGPVQNTSLGATYGYTTHFIDYTMSFGLNLTLNHYGINLSELNPHQTDDNLLTQDRVHQFYPKVNVGFYLNAKRGAFGLIFNNLIETRDLEKAVTLYYQKVPIIAARGHFYLHFTEDLLMEPVFFISKQLNNTSPYVASAGAQFYQKEKIKLGIEYLSTGILATNILFKVSDKLTIGYGYETIFKSFKGGNYGAHNIYIGNYLAVPTAYKSRARTSKSKTL